VVKHKRTAATQHSAIRHLELDEFPETARVVVHDGLCIPKRFKNGVLLKDLAFDWVPSALFAPCVAASQQPSSTHIHNLPDELLCRLRFPSPTLSANDADLATVGGGRQRGEHGGGGAGRVVGRDRDGTGSGPQPPAAAAAWPQRTMHVCHNGSLRHSLLPEARGSPAYLGFSRAHHAVERCVGNREQMRRVVDFAENVGILGRHIARIQAEHPEWIHRNQDASNVCLQARVKIRAERGYDSVCARAHDHGRPNNQTKALTQAKGKWLRQVGRGAKGCEPRGWVLGGAGTRRGKRVAV